MRLMIVMLCRAAMLLPSLALFACGAGGSRSSPIGSDAPPRLLACRARADQPFRFAEVALRDERNLGNRRLADRTGTETGARAHPDGNTIVFARERSNAEPASRELFIAALDGTAEETRLTQNTVRDDDPCWSPDGERILFVSERSGSAALWTIARTGGDAVPFVSPPPGSHDRHPDWHAATDRVVWSRTGSDGRASLWLAHGGGTAAMPLTDGGPLGDAGSGDFEPAWAPDGRSVVFVRRIGATASVLARCELASGTVTVLFAPLGMASTPRVAPAADRVFFGLAEPGAGRGEPRLATVPASGGDAVLLWPDERWRLLGLDLLPSLPAAPAGGDPQRLDVTRAQVQIATATSASGVREQLAEADGDAFALATATSAGREVAAISVRFDLPVDAATDVLALHVRLVARTTRAGAGSWLRSSIYNPVDERFDTAVELPAATTATTLRFSTSSLRHVTAQKQVRVTVIGDLAPGPREQLLVDLVEVVLVARAR